MDKEKRNLLSKLAETVGVCIVQALADLLLKKEKGEDENHERTQ